MTRARVPWSPELPLRITPLTEKAGRAWAGNGKLTVNFKSCPDSITQNVFPKGKTSKKVNYSTCLQTFIQVLKNLFLNQALTLTENNAIWKLSFAVCGSVRQRAPGCQFPSAADFSHPEGAGLSLGTLCLRILLHGVSANVIVPGKGQALHTLIKYFQLLCAACSISSASLN